MKSMPVTSLFKIPQCPLDFHTTVKPRRLTRACATCMVWALPPSQAQSFCFDSATLTIFLFEHSEYLPCASCFCVLRGSSTGLHVTGFFPASDPRVTSSRRRSLTAQFQGAPVALCLLFIYLFIISLFSSAS